MFKSQLNSVSNKSIADILARIESQIERVEDWTRLSKTPVVSVCIMAYNHGNYIGQALDSILMQEFQYPIEIVVGEDKSTDNTREIVCEYQKRHPDKIRLRLARRNIYSQGLMPGVGGRAACRGRYIALLDGDDYWTDSYKLQKQVDFLEANPDYFICFHNVDILCTKGLIRDFITDVPETTDLVYFAKRGNYIRTATTVFRNIFLKGKTLPDYFYKVPIGDFALWLYISQFGKIKKFPEKMAVYRKHSNGVYSCIKPYNVQKMWFDTFNELCEHYISESEYIDIAKILKLRRLEFAVKMINYAHDKNDIESVNYYINQAVKYPDTFLEFCSKSYFVSRLMTDEIGIKEYFKIFVRKFAKKIKFKYFDRIFRRVV